MPFKLDPRNARKHPDRNKEAIRASLEEVGPFRSIAIDGEDIVRAGNGVYEQAQALGLKVRVVEAAADELIAVRRADLTGEKAVRAAVLDNATGETSEWSVDVLTWLKENQPKTVDGIWTAEEWENLIGTLPQDGAWDNAFGGLPDSDRAPFQQMTFTLHDTQAETVKDALSAAKGMGAFENTENENSNGNALARICELFLGEHGQG